MALCMVYRAPYRGLGPDVPSRCASASASRAGKRKARAAGHPEAPTRARRRRRQRHGRIEDDDDTMSFAQILESELLSYFETENSTRGETAAPEHQDKPNGAMRKQDPASNDDDDEVMEISLDEFLGSSAAHPVPPRAAQLESASAAATDADVIEFIPEKLMVASSLDDDDDDDDMCGLACPPMDDDYVELILSEPLVQFDPAFIEEFISDP